MRSSGVVESDRGPAILGGGDGKSDGEKSLQSRIFWEAKSISAANVLDAGTRSHPLVLHLSPRESLDERTKRVDEKRGEAER
jgi:hypothetical protein